MGGCALRHDDRAELTIAARIGKMRAGCRAIRGFLRLTPYSPGLTHRVVPGCDDETCGFRMMRLTCEYSECDT
jgi:hypothetical protein